MQRNFQMKHYNSSTAEWDDLMPATLIEQVSGLDEILTELEELAKGASRGYAFDTEADLDAFLADPTNTANLVVGDNLYVIEEGAQDYWWDGTEKQPLDTGQIALNLASTIADGLMSKANFSKLSAIASGAQVNVIETVKLNGTAITPISKTVDIAVTKSTVGLSNADNTTDANKNVLSASKLTSAKTFTLTGDVTGTASSDLGSGLSIPVLVTPNKTNQKVAVSKNSATATGTRKQINFKDGANVTITVADNAANDAVDITIAAKDTTYGRATASADGLMPNEMFTKVTAAPTITISTAEPASPTNGDLWYDLN